MSLTMTMIALGLAGLLCLVRGIVDFRQRRYMWSATSLLCGGLCLALFLTTPIPTHAMKVELPQTSGT